MKINRITILLFSVLISLIGNTQIVSTIAGTGVNGIGTDDVLGVNSQINSPYGIGVDALGHIYFADQVNNAIRKIDANTGIITTIVGGGITPNGIYVMPNGDIYFTNSQTSSLMKYSVTTGNANTIVTLPSAGLGLCVSGDSIFVALGYVNKVVLVNELTAITTVFAGSGNTGYNGENTSALLTDFNGVTDVDFTADGDLLVCDKSNHRIRKINLFTLNVSTIAGNGSLGFNGNNILATNANLDGPEGIAVSNDGTVYICDSGNNMIRKINFTTFFIELVAGTGSAGFADGTLSTAQFNNPAMAGVGDNGDIYVTDNGNSRVRKIQYCIPADLPTIELGGFETDNCPQELYLYIATGDLNDNDDWQWSFEGCGSQNNVGSGDTLYFNSFTNNVFYVRGEGGCESSSSCAKYVHDSLVCLTDTVNFSVNTFSAFSPNNDDVNDTWIIEGIDSIIQNKVYIYNRWGDLVYYTENYNNIESVWNGDNSLTGERVTVGTFFYVIESNKQRVKSGWVQVIR